MPNTIIYSTTASAILSSAHRYSNITQPYIKYKLTQCAFDKRSYIDDLLLLYNFIQNEVKGYTDNVVFGALQQKYRHEYWELLKTENPDLYKEMRKQHTQKKAKEDQESKKQQEELRIDYADWIKAGGAA